MNSIEDLKVDLKKKENTPLYESEQKGEVVKVDAYLDEESQLMHIAYGHLLEQQQTPEELSVMGIEDELHDWNGFSISIDQANRLLEIDIKDAIDQLKPTFDDEFMQTLTQDRYTALVGMSYQLGGYGVQRWKGMCNAILNGDWDRASDEMLWSDGTKKVKRSAWYTQTQDRCEKAAHAMRTGSFGEVAPLLKDRPVKIVDVVQTDVSTLETSFMLKYIKLFTDELEKRLENNNL